MKKINEVVEDWLLNSELEDGEATMADSLAEAPETAWAAILALVQRDLTPDQTALLAAGPMEDLLAMYGPQFIERVEREAAANPRFNYLLGGVWQNQMSLEIWARVQKARKEEW